MVIWETEYFLTLNLLETGKFDHTPYANRYNAILPYIALLVSPSTPVSAQSSCHAIYMHLQPE